MPNRSNEEELKNLAVSGLVDGRADFEILRYTQDDILQPLKTVAHF